MISREKAMSSTKDLETLIALRTCCFGLLLLMLLCRIGKAQSSQEVQFLPEIDAYLKLAPHVRVSAQAKDTREGGAPTQVEIGPSIELYLNPLIRLRDITVFDLD